MKLLIQSSLAIFGLVAANSATWNNQLVQLEQEVGKLQKLLADGTFFGTPGQKGLKGEPGYPGRRGEFGRKGAKGEEGEPGNHVIEARNRRQKTKQTFEIAQVRGPPGYRGDVGRKGNRGPAGKPGRKGVKGERGQKGFEGSRGPRGPSGVMGPKGERGTPPAIQADFDLSFEAIGCPNRSCDCENSDQAVPNVQFFETGKVANYDDARQICRNMGLEIAEPHTLAENQALSRATKSNFIWIGAKRGQNDYANFYWHSTNQKIQNPFWRDGEPNDAAGGEPCVIMVPGSYKWNDDKCTKTYDVVCQKRICSLDPEGASKSVAAI